MNDSSPFTDTDKLFILPCIQEKRATGNLDKENQASRQTSCRKNGIDVSKKMNTDLEGLCVGENINENSLCTYDNSLYYVGNKNSSCSPEVVWNHIVDFVNRSNLNSIHQSATKNFFIVSHHNTLKKSILATVLASEKKLKKKLRHHIANCSCFLLEHNSNGWVCKLIFDGFPDKTEYNYFQGKNKILFQDEPGFNILKTYLNFIQDRDKTRIFLIRHANAFHNKPLRLTGSALNRTVDTNLTPLGIYQARILGETLIEENYLRPQGNDNVNVFCASYMNRAQHTALELVYALNLHMSRGNLTDDIPMAVAEPIPVAIAEPIATAVSVMAGGKNKRRPSVKDEYKEIPAQNYFRLSGLERFFTDFACSRLIRKSGGLENFLKNINKLAKWEKNFNSSCKKLVPPHLCKSETRVSAESHMMRALLSISQQSMEDWKDKKYCKSFSQKTEPENAIIITNKSGGRRKTKKKRTKKGGNYRWGNYADFYNYLTSIDNAAGDEVTLGADYTYRYLPQPNQYPGAGPETTEALAQKHDLGGGFYEFIFWRPQAMITHSFDSSDGNIGVPYEEVEFKIPVPNAPQPGGGTRKKRRKRKKKKTRRRRKNK